MPFGLKIVKNISHTVLLWLKLVSSVCPAAGLHMHVDMGVTQITIHHHLSKIIYTEVLSAASTCSWPLQLVTSPEPPGIITLVITPFLCGELCGCCVKDLKSFNYFTIMAFCKEIAQFFLFGAYQMCIYFTL